MNNSKYYVILSPVGEVWDRNRTQREASDRHRFIGPQGLSTARVSVDGTQAIVEVSPEGNDPSGVRIIAGPFRDNQCRNYIDNNIANWLVPLEQGGR